MRELGSNKANGIGSQEGVPLLGLATEREGRATDKAFLFLGRNNQVIDLLATAKAAAQMVDSDRCHSNQS